MRVLQLIVAVQCLTFVGLCHTFNTEDNAPQTPAEVIDDLHQAAAEADGERYFSHFTSNAIFLGTDGSERWTLKEFRAFAEPYFSQGRGWTYVVIDRHMYTDGDGNTTWFDEVVENEKYGECRGTGVLVRIDGAWKIAQYNLTIPVPNDFSAEVVRAAKGLNVAPTTIYVVRHAMKLHEPANPDPELNPTGLRQAQQLQQMLHDEKIHAIYTTPFLRTRHTAKPTATAQDVELIELDGRAITELTDRLTTEHAGQSVLVVGHSNTVPKILQGLNVTTEVTLEDMDYGDLFVVTLDGRGGSSMIHLRFDMKSE